MSWLFNNEFPYTDFHELNLSWLIEKYKFLLEALQKIDGWIEEHEKEYEELLELYNQILSGDFPDEMLDSLKEWTIKNTQEIIGAAIKTVFFGLEDGYFVAYIPEGWEEIIFGTTGLDDFIAGFDFGHLTLTY